tara:strand:- start:259 stop:1422 length:1164 start_codon:yes stop_codon:yes gene_type:complete
MIEAIIKTRVVIGKEELQNLPTLISRLGVKKFGFIIDQALEKNAKVIALINLLEKKKLVGVVYYYDLPFEPDYDSLEDIKYKFKEKESNRALVDIIVAIGGGSTIDFAKGIATLVTNHKHALMYKGFPEGLEPSIPLVAVPSTAGTASEVTFNAVFTDNKSGRKLGINTHNNFPILAILDSELTKDCPFGVALSSGLDAMVHCFESFACKKSNYFTKMFAKEAIGHLIQNIERALNDRSDDEAREKMLFGAYLAGISLYNSGSGPAGGLSYPLGVVCKVPHGIAGGFVLPHLIEFNVKNGYLGYDDLAAHLGISAKDGKSRSESLVAYIFDLYDRLKVWSYVEKYNVSLEDPLLSEYIEMLQGAFDQNPIPFSVTDGKEIVQKIFNN